MLRAQSFFFLVLARREGEGGMGLVVHIELSAQVEEKPNHQTGNQAHSWKICLKVDKMGPRPRIFRKISSR